VARSVVGIVTAVAVVSSWASPVRAQDKDMFAGMTGIQIGALAGANFFTFGGGLRFRAGAGSLMVEARYTFGLSRVFESWTVHTQGVSLGAGFSTPLGRY
jgi:hypothetical protein